MKNNLPKGSQLAIRINKDNPNHHISKNGSRWWINITVHLPDYTGYRPRFSLKTRDVHEARRRRDEILGMYSNAKAEA